MDLKNFGKKGQTTVTYVLGGLVLLFIAMIGISFFVNFFQAGASSSVVGTSLSNSINSVSKGFVNVLGPTFNVLLGLDSSTSSENVKFLMILTFILISIIVIGTLDSVNIFGSGRSFGAELINFAVGMIVAIIGIRFMPDNLWESLTAPSSAFVATVLVSIPFLALFFVTSKIKFGLASKLLWLFYVIFMSFLIFSRKSTMFSWIYGIFLLGGVIMMIFDASVRRFWHKEKAKLQVEDRLGAMNVRERMKLRRQIAEWNEVIADTTAPEADRKRAKKEMELVKSMYGDFSTI